MARDYSNNYEHVAFSINKEADGLMSVFKDLMIMVMGVGVWHMMWGGIGGWGRVEWWGV